MSVSGFRVYGIHKKQMHRFAVEVHGPSSPEFSAVACILELRIVVFCYQDVIIIDETSFIQQEHQLVNFGCVVFQMCLK